MLGRLVTFGIIPSSPETGFGYIESEEKLSVKIKASPIIRFIEKPDIELAKNLFLDKRFSWNSGMFMFKVSTILDEFKKFAPEILEFSIKALELAKLDLDFLRLDENHFSSCPKFLLIMQLWRKQI